MNNSVNWHFPRPQLADKYLKQIENGLSTNILLFAERMAGKTEFIKQDLLPMARDRGFLTFTIDFWSNKKNPVKEIYEALIGAYEQLKLKDSIAASAASTGILKRFEIGSTVDTVTLDTLSGIFSAFSIVMEKMETKVLMHLDEVQHLATDPSFEPATAALRTFMDKNRGWLFSVMTGSSSDNLQKLFSRSKAPFYQCVEIEEFPKLGADFVEHMLSCYEQSTGVALSQRDAIDAYRFLHGNPEKFNALVRSMAKARSTDFLGMWSVIAEGFNRRPAIEADWDSLNDIEAGVAVLVLLKEKGNYGAGLYSIQSFDFVAVYAGVKSDSQVSKSTIQTAIDKFCDMGWICRDGHGNWKYEDLDAKSYVEEIAGI